MKAVTQDNFTELDLYYVFHHCQISSIKRYQLPNEFIKYILPCLKGQSWKTVQSALSAFWNGSAKENTILLCTLSRALSTRIDCTNTLQNILFVPESRRVLWIAMQINTDTLSAPCLPENIELFHSLTTNDYYRDNLYFFLLSLKRGIYPDYFFTALRLINEFDVRDSFARSKVFYKCTIPAYEVIRRIIATISEADDYYKNNVIDLWERCGELDQYVSFLNSRDWSKYSPNTAFELYRLFSSFFDRYELSESQIQEKWYFLRDQADVIESMVQDIEVEYRPRFIMQLGDYFWYWDTIEALEEYIPPAYIFAKRMSKSPFSTTKCSATYLLSDFIDKLSKERLSEFLNIPDTSLITIEDQSKSDNNSRLINYGMFHLIKEIPELVMICVNSYLKKLCKVAKKQGVLTRAQRYPTICNFKNHPLMNADLHKLNTTDLCDRITPYVSDTISNPIPKKLQLFIRGEYTLTEQRIERYRSKIFENLPATQLDILEQITIDVIKSNHDYTSVESNKAEHTMMLMNWIDDNRRAFKRFLHEYSEGNINYLKDHPATEQWKKGHPDLDSSKWEQGLILHYDSKELGPIRLEIEQEPLEALRLGSYVGSCLGVGGICSYSAAAVILDYNKQVLYARNENNKVIARQVVTISEQKSLVCFSVYPVGVDEELQIMFKNYDEQLSTHLGYDLYIDENNDNRVEKNKPKAKDADKDEESDYTISHILSHDWWDDTPWDFTIENKQKES